MLSTKAVTTTTEPARTNLEDAFDTPALHTVAPPEEAAVDRARPVLEETGTNGDVQLVAAVLPDTTKTGGRCLDERGLHMTGELRAAAGELTEDAAKRES